jgi:hypothetical protein
MAKQRRITGMTILCSTQALYSPTGIDQNYMIPVPGGTIGFYVPVL